jgi:hypothetical protein
MLFTSASSALSSAMIAHDTEALFKNSGRTEEEFQKSYETINHLLYSLHLIRNSNETLI